CAATPTPCRPARSRDRAYASLAGGPRRRCPDFSGALRRSGPLPGGRRRTGGCAARIGRNLAEGRRPRCYAWRPSTLRAPAAMTARIASLHIYPIKSCAAIDLAESTVDRAGLTGDRRWMILTGQGHFMTQRQWPAMALIRPAITADALELRAPDMPVLRIPLDGSQLAADTRLVRVWNDTVPA